jgi:hypothetical protein
MLNPIGIVCALTTFVSVWLGHVVVRRLEFVARHLLPVTLGFLTLGILAEFLALRQPNQTGSAVLGILGITFLWDAFEVVRQERRIYKGHAPANPDNPRHAAIMKQSPAATTQDWLQREPRGAVYSAAELEAIARMKA